MDKTKFTEEYQPYLKGIASLRMIERSLEMLGLFDTEKGGAAVEHSYYILSHYEDSPRIDFYFKNYGDDRTAEKRLTTALEYLLPKVTNIRKDFDAQKKMNISMTHGEVVLRLLSEAPDTVRFIENKIETTFPGEKGVRLEYVVDGTTGEECEPHLPTLLAKTRLGVKE